MRIQLLGLRRKHISLVKSIVPFKTALFLFDFETKLLHGVYEATSPGGDNINPKAWTSNKKSRSSPYPAQVKFQIFIDCAPLPEAEYERVMEYYDKKHKHFSFKLRKQQVEQLIQVFEQHDQKVKLGQVPYPQPAVHEATEMDEITMRRPIPIPSQNGPMRPPNHMIAGQAGAAFGGPQYGRQTHDPSQPLAQGQHFWDPQAGADSSEGPTSEANRCGSMPAVTRVCWLLAMCMLAFGHVYAGFWPRVCWLLDTCLLAF